MFREREHLEWNLVNPVCWSFMDCLSWGKGASVPMVICCCPSLDYTDHSVSRIVKWHLLVDRVTDSILWIRGVNVVGVFCAFGFVCMFFLFVCFFVVVFVFFLKRFWVEDRHLSQVPMGSVNPVFCKAFTVTSVSSQRNLTSALQMNDLLRTSTMIMIQCLCY